jgi:hypothetical protein
MLQWIKRQMESFVRDLRGVNRSDRALRHFGLFFAAILAGVVVYDVVGTGQLIARNAIVPALAGGLVLSAVFRPRLLLGPYLVWMGLGIVLGLVFGNVVLSVVYVTVVSPIAILRRLWVLWGRTNEPPVTYWVRHTRSPLSGLEQPF